MSWRIIPAKAYSAAENMAIDKAIYEDVKMGVSPPTLRFFYWMKGAVSIGHNSPSSMVNLDALHQDGVEYVRRPTGGLYVYHHPQDLSISAIASLQDAGITSTTATQRVQDIYDVFREWIINGLHHAGLEAQMSGKSDIAVDNKKIFGCSQNKILGKDYFLVHGTFFYRSTANDWAKYTTLDASRLRGISSICSLKQISQESFYASLLKGLQGFALFKDCYHGFLSMQEVSSTASYATHFQNNFEGDGSREGFCATDQ